MYQLTTKLKDNFKVKTNILQMKQRVWVCILKITGQYSWFNRTRIGFLSINKESVFNFYFLGMDVDHWS